MKEAKITALAELASDAVGVTKHSESRPWVIEAVKYALENYPAMSLNDYQDKAAETAIYPGAGTFIGLQYVSGKLAGEAGEVIENVCKALRDDGALQRINAGEVPVWYVNDITVERRAKLVKELGDVLWYCAMVAKELGYTFQYIAEENNRKLADRHARGVLSGSGDER